eukprot:CAMPEP_0169161968 /NCGR_PEP_ID=MMETSP1015-20121227/57373_1 /TAXON_ID=342587 /ORGANISM="Karlodinium micrum, Strain CCMP2283" /LENGTH=64 /DNA_ID=CAMNT_0009233951 /DNA_START=311 /DNA_END=502 /DNA_ORIENTATION=+
MGVALAVAAGCTCMCCCMAMLWTPGAGTGSKAIGLVACRVRCPLLACRLGPEYVQASGDAAPVL